MKADSLFYVGLSLGLVAGIFKVLTEALIVVTSKCSEDEDSLNTGQGVAENSAEEKFHQDGMIQEEPGLRDLKDAV